MSRTGSKSDSCCKPLVTGRNDEITSILHVAFAGLRTMIDITATPSYHINTTSVFGRNGSLNNSKYTDLKKGHSASCLILSTSWLSFWVFSEIEWLSGWLGLSWRKQWTQFGSSILLFMFMCKVNNRRVSEHVCQCLHSGGDQCGQMCVRGVACLGPEPPKCTQSVLYESRCLGTGLLLMYIATPAM